MAIPQLPNEITSMIISYLLGPKEYEERWSSLDYTQRLSSYASVSRVWQALVERYTFSSLYLTRDRLEDGKRIVNPSRSRQIRMICFEVVLDSYGVEPYGQTETYEEQQRNNIVCTNDMQSLFQYLSTWSSSDVFAGGSCLKLIASSPTDRIGGGIFMPRWMDSSLEYMLPNNPLPQLEFVHKLVWDPILYRNPGCSVGNALLQALPQVRDLVWTLEPRKRNKDDERAGMMKNLPSTITDLNLKNTNIVANDNYTLATLDDQDTGGLEEHGEDAKGEDTLSSCIRTASQRLKTLHLNGSFSRDTIWPTRPSSCLELPFWPRLTHLQVIYTPLTPERTSMSTSIDNLSVSGYDYETDEDVLNEFYYDVMKAALRMPRLERIFLGANIRSDMHTFSLVLSETEVMSRTTMAMVPFQPDERVFDLLEQFATVRGLELSFEASKLEFGSESFEDEDELDSETLEEDEPSMEANEDENQSDSEDLEG